MVNCKSPGDLKLDLDISGPGVIISFVASGTFALLLSTFYYFFFYDPEAELHPSPVDKHILSFRTRLLKWLGRRWGIGRKNWEKYKTGCEQGILSLCDLQILLGLSLLTSGFIQITSTPAFYWRFMVYVAWFSFLTNQCAMILCRPYLRNNFAARTWRIILISTVFVLLLVAALPTIFFAWDYHSMGTVVGDRAPSAPVSCYFNRKERSNFSPSMELLTGEPRAINTMLSLVYLLLSYVIRIVQLYSSASDFFRQRLIPKAGSLLRLSFSTFIRWLDKLTYYRIGPKFWFLLVESPLLAIYLALHIVVVLFTSALSDLCGLYFGCMIGLFNLIDQKKREPDKISPSSENAEDTMKLSGFGQLLPLMLLSSPIIAVVQAFIHGTSMNKINHRASGSSGNVDPRGYIRSRLPSLRDRARWERLDMMLLENNLWVATELPAAVFGVALGEIFILIMTFTWIVVPDSPKTLYLIIQYLVVLEQPVFYSLTIVQITVITAGWERRAAKRICWLVIIAAALGYIVSWTLVLLSFFHLIGFIAIPLSLYATLLLVCLVLSLIPQRWGQQPVLYEQNDSNPVPLSDVEVLPASNERSNRPGPGDIS